MCLEYKAWKKASANIYTFVANRGLSSRKIRKDYAYWPNFSLSLVSPVWCRRVMPSMLCPMHLMRVKRIPRKENRFICGELASRRISYYLMIYSGEKYSSRITFCVLELLLFLQFLNSAISSMVSILLNLFRVGDRNQLSQSHVHWRVRKTGYRAMWR